jgi:Zinc knuckle
MRLQKSKRSKTNEIALGASDMSKSEKGKGQNGKWGKKLSLGEQDLSKITCFNCGGKGHKADKCPSLKTERKKVEIAEAAVSAEVDNDSDDIAWATEDFEKIPQPTEELFAPSEQAAPDLGIESLITPYLAILATPQNMDTTNFASYEIFDSRATRYMTPDRHRLQNYKAIPDHPISTANQ